MSRVKKVTVRGGHPEHAEPQIVERPDGFWWTAGDGGREYGPFRTLVEAEQDMLDSGSETSYEPGETLAEAESEIGISDWIDPDTGLPAEEAPTRTEDH